MPNRENKLSNAASKKQSSYDDIDQLKQEVTEEPQKRLNVEIPESLHTELKLYATRNGTTITDVVEGLIRDQLSE